MNASSSSDDPPVNEGNGQFANAVPRLVTGAVPGAAGNYTKAQVTSYDMARA